MRAYVRLLLCVCARTRMRKQKKEIFSTSLVPWPGTVVAFASQLRTWPVTCTYICGLKTGEVFIYAYVSWARRPGDAHPSPGQIPTDALQLESLSWSRTPLFPSKGPLFPGCWLPPTDDVSVCKPILYLAAVYPVVLDGTWPYKRIHSPLDSPFVNLVEWIANAVAKNHKHKINK